MEGARVTEVMVELDGPEGTPYQGGLFKLKLVLGQEDPTKPPEVWFITKIFHPNVSKKGEVCGNVLQKHWSASVGLEQVLDHVLNVVRRLLVEPECGEPPKNGAARNLFLRSAEDFGRMAKDLTQRHGMREGKRGKRPRPEEGSPEEGSPEEGSPGPSHVDKKVKVESEALKYPIYKVLNRTHPGLGISQKGVVQLTEVCDGLFQRLAREASKFTEGTMTCREMQRAVESVLPEPLAKFAIERGIAAVTKFSSGTMIEAEHKQDGAEAEHKQDGAEAEDKQDGAED